MSELLLNVVQGIVSGLLVSGVLIAYTEYRVRKHQIKRGPLAALRRAEEADHRAHQREMEEIMQREARAEARGERTVSGRDLDEPSQSRRSTARLRGRRVQ